MELSKHKNAIMITIAILWIAIMFLGWANNFVLGMVLGVVLMFLHMVLGASHNDKLSVKFLIYPLLAWAILWIASFVLSEHFAVKFAGQIPTFNVAGLHPSFAPTFYMYWLGGMLTLSLGYYLLQNEWLSEEVWNNFLDEVKQLEDN